MPAGKPFAAGAEEPSRARQLRVLIVDDERDTVLTLMELLRLDGHEPKGAYSGAQALEAVRAFAPDVVVLDISMPGKSGWEVAREMRELAGERLTLVAISGHFKSPSDRLLSHVVGFDHYLPKPFEVDQLLALVRQIASAR